MTQTYAAGQGQRLAVCRTNSVDPVLAASIVAIDVTSYRRVRVVVERSVSVDATTRRASRHRILGSATSARSGYPRARAWASTTFDSFLALLRPDAVAAEVQVR